MAHQPHLMCRVLGIFGFLILGIFAQSAQSSYNFNFDIFTSNGNYHDDPGVKPYVVVSNGEEAIVDFTFYNISEFQSSVAQIYFDDGVLLDISTVTNGPGTIFSENAQTPNNLPGWNLIDFHADREFTIGALSPPPENGVNPATPLEWVTIRFDLVPGANLESVVDELYTGELRIGIHIIGLPDGSSESAIMVIPEPATIAMLLFGVALMKKRR